MLPASADHDLEVEPVSDLLARLCENVRPWSTTSRVLVVAAHPDDDVLGAGGLLGALASGAGVAFVSDGAPRRATAYREAGFESREALADVRRREMREALALAGVDLSRVRELGAVDQEVALEIPRLTGALVALILGMRPDVVLSHPYEGGHPDHDATALAVHAACVLLHRAGRRTPALLEFASYHEQNGRLVTGEFIPDPARSEHALKLDANARELKRQMLRCHRSQQPILSQFRVDEERFRVAPRYDFTSRPAQSLYYERFDWGMTGERFVCLARAALSALRISGPC
jgi:LmbE family N-acetylglucosaminyl deacetylase